jgi:hypothetical protein
MNFTAQQPKDGEVICHCGHIDEPKYHFYKVISLGFRRPDGTTGKADWIVVCDSCFLLHPDSPEKVIRGDSIWKGDEPIIEDRSS